MIVFILVIVLFFLIFTIKLFKKRKCFKLPNVTKLNMSSLPIFGISHNLFGTDEHRLKQLMFIGRDTLKNNGIVSCWLGYVRCISVADPVLADFISRNCLRKQSNMETIFAALFGNSGIFAPVNIWRPRRKIVTPIFSPNTLKEFVTIFATQSNKLVEKLKHTTGKPISILEYFFTYALNSVCETSLGVPLNDQSEASQFAHSVDYASSAVARRIMQPWLWIDFIYNLTSESRAFTKHKQFIDDYVKQLMDTKRKQMKEERAKHQEISRKVKSIMELLMESPSENKLTDAEMLEETETLIMAGTDTTGVAASFIALMLARHPDVQEKVYKELKQTLKEGTNVTAEYLPKLKYLDAVIKETLRLYSPALGVLRENDKEITLPSGVTLPANCTIFLHLWAINRNPQYWGADAEEFRPERFLEYIPKHAAQFASFSLGPRNCIGGKYAMMSLKTVIATVVRQYRVLLADQTSIQKPIRLELALLMKDVDKFMVRLETRLTYKIE